ncbi:MAG: tetratricopeptide repeat protein [Syntrophales bacterium]|nr:tetratricopeptide repeat protein [Syntrophales bacterium]MCK9391831.1 tetratricopeptide repeat protein [Syntrophales bacterium]
MTPPKAGLPIPEIADSSSRWRWLICLGLALSVLAVFGRLAFFDFVFFDDHVYIIEKAQVLAGLTPESIRWAFTATDAGFWHPLTWISLMIDHEIWGLNPGGYHITNVLLHLAATLLLFAALHRLTGTLWKSGFVAALFALHPLHVESVAWIAERKDVLSGLFWMLSLFLYARYVESPGWGRYGLVLISFVLGLMAKPMMVTLPVIMLLLDVWPGKRLSGGNWRRNWKLVLGEKIPFLILGVAAGVVTMMAEQQVGALKSFEEFPFFVRLTNAVVAYGFYLYKMVLPFNLSVHYPHPGAWPMGPVALSLAVLGTITYFSIRSFKYAPYLLVGWLWYLISLLPVIGLIQIGGHAFADRYTYIPLIGIFIAVVWGVGGLAEQRRLRQFPINDPRQVIGVQGNDKEKQVSRDRREIFAVTLGMIVIVFFALISVVQVECWQNAETLFRQAVAVTENNYLAHNNLGAALSLQGRYREALPQFEKALQIRPGYQEALFNKGAALAGQGRYREALPFYGRVLALQPRFAEGHNNIAIAYAQTGNINQAIIHFREAIRIRPGYGDAIKNLKIAEKKKNREAAK